MSTGYWLAMLVGYLISISIETPVLVACVSRRHPMRDRLFAGVWLTACTYPVLWLALPAVIDPGEQRALYLAVGETFVAVAECLLFWLAFGRAEPRSRAATVQDMAAVTLANLLSFGLGELLIQTGNWNWLLGEWGL
jgi:hypothetical protein